MTLTKNDPRLTAFVLGELTEEETREIQAAIENDAELKTEVDAIRQTVAEIEAVMQAEPLPTQDAFVAKNSVAKKVDQPEEPKGAKKRRFPLRVVELSLVVLLVGILAGLIFPAIQSAREAWQRGMKNNVARQTEMDAEASTKAAAEGKPIEDARPRYEQPSDVLHEDVSGTKFLSKDTTFDLSKQSAVMNRPLVDPQSDGKREERHRGFVEGLMESESSFVPMPEESAPASSVSAVPARESGLAADPGSARGTDLLYYGGSVVGGVAIDGKGNVAGRQRRMDRTEKKDELYAGEKIQPLQMMVTPRIIIQEEEEEYLTGIRDVDGIKSAQLGRPARKPATKMPTEERMTKIVDTNFQQDSLQRGEKVLELLEKRYEELDNSGQKELAAKLRKELDRKKQEIARDPYNSANDEAYKNFVENEFLKPKDAPFSTFSIDVDSAAYTTMRRYVNQGQHPPADSVRLEEYVNYFKYDYDQPKDGRPFATHVDVAACPWNDKHLLARIGIKGKEYTVDERPPLNLVFLIDTSGSMESSNRLPLVKRGLTELVEMLQPKDRVAIVTYAGSSRVALPSVSGQEKRAILDSINSLGAGGSTAGAAGIKTAYETARKYYDKKAQNRVILCTDGDFNVGQTDNKTLETMIGQEAKSGVFLTILGFGMGNYKDERLKTLSMRGNGNYGYVDTIEEARRLLVEGLTGTLFAIAKDVKIQVDFNPKRVAGYRLLGYENRKLRDEDFHNDKIDAGEIGAGHTVTALYEIVPLGGTVPSKVDESRYAEKSADVQSESSVDAANPARKDDSAFDGKSKELMFVKLRYKQPDEDKSSLLEYPVVFDAEIETEQALSGDAQFAAAVALYGMLLRNSRYSGDGTFDGVLELARPNAGEDRYRKEFVELVEKAKRLND